MTQIENIKEEFLSFEEVCNLLQVEQKFLLKEIEDKNISAKKIGNQIIIQTSKLKVFLRNSNVGKEKGKYYPRRENREDF
jgi:excisionase family DNA binding protein